MLLTKLFGAISLPAHNYNASILCRLNKLNTFNILLICMNYMTMQQFVVISLMADTNMPAAVDSLIDTIPVIVII